MILVFLSDLSIEVLYILPLFFLQRSRRLGVLTENILRLLFVVPVCLWKYIQELKSELLKSFTECEIPHHQGTR